MNGIRDCARNLRISNSLTSPDGQVTVKAAEVVLEDDAFQPLRVSDVNVTGDVSHSGPNGLDVGTVAPDSWYYIWLIAHNSSHTAALLSLSPDKPKSPPGYNFNAFLGAIQTDSYKRFYRFSQFGRTVARNAVAFQGEPVAVATAINCANALPKRAIKAFGSFDLNPNIQQAAPGYGDAWLASKPNQGMVQFRGYLQTRQSWFSAPFCIPVVESQTLYYQVAQNTNVGSIAISISGFEF